MTWLFPLYLLGAAAIVAPILMHLRRRPPQNQVEFSSLMFLEAQTPVPVSKRRLENWLLLLLRCLVLLLLAFMFARPLWRGAQDETGSHDRATAILVDRSASMRRGDLWQQAVTQATQEIQTARPEDRIAAAAFDGSVHPLWGFDDEAANRATTLKQRLVDTKAGWDKTDLGKALITAVEWFGSASSTKGRRKHIVVITDLQEGTQLDALRSLVWPEDISLEVKRLEVPNLDNLSVALAAGTGEEPGAEAETASAAVRVRLANARDSKVSDFTLAWEHGGGDEIKGYLPPGSSRVLPAPPKPAGDGARILRISGDAWDFDNRLYAAPLQPKKARLVFIGDEKTR
ncbi:MAG TPA: BatA domain-containing protein, partial [Prosthecobacter sp.]|nr:BatA domain-containing protein [Prosthecobacter sp.]